MAKFAAALAALLALSACDDAAHKTAAADPSSAPASAPDQPAAPDYASPPRVQAVSTGGGGAAIVSGVAAPDSRIRAVSADQTSYGATTGHDGRFQLEMPPVGRSRLVALSVEGPPRSIRATGWLFVPPDAPERSVMLKAGAAAGPLVGAGLVAAVDYDQGGGVAISGRAAPDASVALAVGASPAQEVKADASGNWSMRLADRLPPGAYALHVRSGGQRFDQTVVLAARAAPGVFQAVREHDAWRVDWTPPGGGAQTTLVLLGAPPQPAGQGGGAS